MFTCFPEFEIVEGRNYTLRIRDAQMFFERVEATDGMAEQYRTLSGVHIILIQNEEHYEVLVTDAVYNRGQTYRSVFLGQRFVRRGRNLSEEFLVTVDLGLVAVNLRLMRNVHAS